MIILFSLAMLLTIAVFFFIRQAKFGQSPTAQRLELMKKSPHFKDGKFHNTTHTPDLTKGYSYSGILYDQLFKDHPRRNPLGIMPSKKINLQQLAADANVLVWFGHSSYFIQVDGKRILVDPVLSGSASPVPWTVQAYKGTDRYTVEDLPPIDYLIISHDHYDHLDYETVIKLEEKASKVICGLGVGAHFERWGYPEQKIIESDWNNTISMDGGFKIHATPARHFSGRGLTRNNTLWMSYVLQTPTTKIYIGGDSGYDTHFAEIGNLYGPIDLAILENGQYNLAWEAIHMLPEQVIRAAEDLKAKRLFPVHSSKFTLAMHAWDEPLIKVAEIAKLHNLPLITPVIGEMINLGNTTQVYPEWWKSVN